MNLHELRVELDRCQSLTECDEFLKTNFREIRPLFYGLTKEQLRNERFNYDDVFFLCIANSPFGKAIRAGNEPPNSIVALLIFFLSLFERACLYHSVYAVAELIPSTYPLRRKCEAIFAYKSIQNSAIDYLDRFDRILELLQVAWEASTASGRLLTEDLFKEYVLDSFIEPKVANFDIRPNISKLCRAPEIQQQFPLLLKPSIQELLNLPDGSILRERRAVRSRIIEALHTQACILAPESLCLKNTEEFVDEGVHADQVQTQLPFFLDAQLEQMGAVFNRQRRNARVNFDLDTDGNRIYLGTYFPKSVIESWCITTELLSIPLISAAFRQKEAISLLDVGSGTGAAVVGILLALADWGRCDSPVEVTSLDTNEDALAKQKEILESLRKHLPFELFLNLRQIRLPFELDGFVANLSTIAEQEGHRYDMVTCWKCLSEFYNVNFAQAQGIVCNMVRLASSMLVPNGLCVVNDVTTTDNNYEFFAYTLNREINEHDSAPDAEARTILPLPCGKKSSFCTEKSCYTQRRFRVSHKLAPNDQTKTAYRVLAPTAFAQSITAAFNDLPGYCVNAAKPQQGCFNGRKNIVDGDIPCGYTGFFHKGE